MDSSSRQWSEAVEGSARRKHAEKSSSQSVETNTIDAFESGSFPGIRPHKSPTIKVNFLEFEIID